MPVLYDELACREIYLVFMETFYFGHQFLKDGFKHVYAIERQALGWLCTDPSTSDMHTYILPARYDADVIKEFIRQNPTFTILSLKVKQHHNPIFPNLSLLSCVSAMQYLLGIYWPFILTPYQLYNKLKNNPPKHIEVTAWHDTQNTRHNGKRKPQQPKPIHCAESLKPKPLKKKPEMNVKKSKLNVC